MPEQQYVHLQITREEPVNQRRPGQPPRFSRPADLPAHGRALLTQLATARQTAETETVAGFDDRKLIKFKITEIRPDDLQVIPGVELVSQEDKTVVLAFATEQALAEFEARLTTLSTGGTPTRAQLLYSLQGVEVWTEEDRKGWALRQEGLPRLATFSLDIELWPLSSEQQRRQMMENFERWLLAEDIQRIDTVNQENLTLYRVRVNPDQAQLLLRHRDVRTVDLPPQYGMDQQLLQFDVQGIPVPPPPPEGAPGIVVLDSGVAGGHPLLASAFGDAQSFVPGLDPSDETGHGTHIAGLALYGDVEECMQARTFIPSLWIHSGKILDNNNENDSGFVHNHITAAVRYFLENYGCRVFNLSFGDSRKPYGGRHVNGLAVTLDYLARTERVLFIVSSGNFEGAENVPQDWVREYPGYLLTDGARLLDPAPALNAITVGSLARWDATFTSQRYRQTVEEVPIARRDQPSPFTRSGPSVNDAIKPDLVAYGGNRAVRVRGGGLVQRGLGELSTNRDFAGGIPWGERFGTSFSAPHVAHLAAKVFAHVPGAAPDLVRAILISHARPPLACFALFANHESDLRRVCGYGQVQDDSLFRSTESDVTLYSADSIMNKRHHFFEIPIPEDYYSQGRRRRELTVALAYSPPVRTTRIDYKGCKISFKVVEAESLDAVATSFNAATAHGDFEGIPEFLPANRELSETARSKGTVQASTWVIKVVSEARRQKRLFVVVTRNDPPWGEAITNEREEYSLVICLRDREAQNARLYTQIRTQLEARVRARVRV